jgi:hypothetical protein
MQRTAVFAQTCTSPCMATFGLAASVALGMAFEERSRGGALDPAEQHNGRLQTPYLPARKNVARNSNRFRKALRRWC